MVLRHAKAAWPDVEDRDRPLAPRGRRDAPVAGRWLRDQGLLPDLVLCSPARRTTQTWELAAAQFQARIRVHYEEQAYRADAMDLLALVHQAPEEVATLLLVGHHPAVQDLIVLLAGESAGDTLQRVGAKFPTSAIAVLVTTCAWAQLQPGGARLTEAVVPRAQASGSISPSVQRPQRPTEK
ncbi:histidine phosphatase family protein [Streptacidiphilus sp. 4-A2]|nr:histidine phosphatase family protein [Streptacidiphilus sp. 4-A2]